jgi:protein-L-isoaspartate O-methyltransferase
VTDPIRGYDEGAEVLAARYEQLRAEDAHAAFLDVLPPGVDRLALDVGAGSGRDAAWLRHLGFEVVAVEPAQRMRGAAQAFHPDQGIRWLDDRLPALSATHRLASDRGSVPSPA